jgi:hypothetical protein
MPKGPIKGSSTLNLFLKFEARLDELEAQQSIYSEQETEQFRRRIKEPTEDEIEFNLDSDKLAAWSTFIDAQIKTNSAGNEGNAVGREIRAILDEIRAICSHLPIPGMFYDDYETPFSEEFVEALCRRWRSWEDWICYSNKRKTILAYLSESGAGQIKHKRLETGQRRRLKTSARDTKWALEYLQKLKPSTPSSINLMMRIGDRSKKEGERHSLTRSGTHRAITAGLRHLGVKSADWIDCKPFIDRNREPLLAYWEGEIDIEDLIRRIEQIALRDERLAAPACK